MNDEGLLAGVNMCKLGAINRHDDVVTRLCLNERSVMYPLTIG